jgi:protein phosphatase
VLERHGSKDFCVGLAEMNGWRNSMEDAHIVHLRDGEAYFGILDGHGGAECSAWCQERLEEILKTEGVPVNDAAAKQMVLKVDAEFLKTGLGSGSNAAMCVVRKPAAAGGKYRLHVINARVIDDLLGGDGGAL